MYFFYVQNIGSEQAMMMIADTVGAGQCVNVTSRVVTNGNKARDVAFVDINVEITYFISCCKHIFYDALLSP